MAAQALHIMVVVDYRVVADRNRHHRTRLLANRMKMHSIAWCRTSAVLTKRNWKQSKMESGITQSLPIKLAACKTTILPRTIKVNSLGRPIAGHEEALCNPMEASQLLPTTTWLRLVNLKVLGLLAGRIKVAVKQQIKAVANIPKILLLLLMQTQWGPLIRQPLRPTASRISKTTCKRPISIRTKRVQPPIR